MHLTDWRNGSASDSSPEGYVFESRIGHTKVAGAAARSFPKLTRPPNAGGGAAMSKESVAEAKKRADALAKKKKAAEVPRPRPYITARGCSSVAERPLCMRKAQGSNPCSSNPFFIQKTTPWRNG